MHSEFRDLVAYRRASETANYLYDEVARWKPVDRWSLGVQLTRAADSIGANIAEAESRRQVDRRRYLIIARGSLQETEHWLARARARGLVPRSYDSEIALIARTLSGLIRRLS